MSTEGEAAIHPKMKSRYTQVKRETGQRRLRVLTTLVILLVLIGISVLILLSPITDIDQISLHGVPVNLEQAVKRASKIHKGEPLVLVRANKVAANVEKVPDIASARVQVHWPHDVDIYVTLRHPSVVVKVDDKYIPIDSDGEVLNSTSAKPDKVVELTGVGKLPSAGKKVSGEVLAAAQLVAGLNPTTIGRISSYTVDPEHSVLTIRQIGKNSGNVTFILGGPSDPDAKAVAIDTVLSGVKLTNGMIIDVSSPRSPLISNGTTTTMVTANAAGSTSPTTPTTRN